MILKELIERLEKEDPELIIINGFLYPHSYRGDYYDLAFEPEKNVKVRDILDRARNCIGAVFSGWKGGVYKMGKYTDVYLAEMGHTGEELGKTLLEYIIKESKEES